MKIVYLGNAGAADTAMAAHTRNIAWVLKERGYQVVFICNYPGRDVQRFNSDGDFTYIYEKRTAIKYLRTIENYYQSITGSRLLHLLKEEENKGHIDLVILYGYYGEPSIVRYCHRRGIKVIADRTDWFEPEDCNDLFSKIYCALFSSRYISDYDKNLDGVIAISKYLQKHYDKLGVKSFWMPPLWQFADEQVELSEGKPYGIVYAGNLGYGKDTVEPLIRVMLRDSKYKDKVQLRLVGISKKELSKEFGEIDWESNGIFPYGRVQHSEVIKILRKSDFGILLRQNKRYAKAGFSTKFVEAMSNGLPMICTGVGGADEYIEDKVDGIVLPNNEEATLEELLLFVTELSVEQVNSMKKAAFAKSKSLFSAELYGKKLECFINDLLLNT